MTQLTIITGASRGLGHAIALQLLARGEHVLTIARQPSESLAAAARPGQLEQWSADLADPLPVAERLQAWLGHAPAQQAQRLTLINNAGALSTPGPLADTALAELSSTLRVSLEATLLLSAAFLNATQALAVPRKILNISSGLGRRAMAGSVGYCTAKAGMDHLSRALALEQATLAHPARIVSLAPGVIATDMQLQLRSADPRQFAEQTYFEALHAQQQLSSPAASAQAILAYLDRPDFGDTVTADIRTP